MPQIVIDDPFLICGGEKIRFDNADVVRELLRLFQIEDEDEGGEVDLHELFAHIFHKVLGLEVTHESIAGKVQLFQATYAYQLATDWHTRKPEL